jgi:hypothetical protein
METQNKTLPSRIPLSFLVLSAPLKNHETMNNDGRQATLPATASPIPFQPFPFQSTAAGSAAPIEPLLVEWLDSELCSIPLPQRIKASGKASFPTSSTSFSKIRPLASGSSEFTICHQDSHLQRWSNAIFMSNPQGVLRVPKVLPSFRACAVAAANDTFVDGETGLSHFLVLALFAPLNQVLRELFLLVMARWAVTNPAPRAADGVPGQRADWLLAFAEQILVDGKALLIIELKTFLAVPNSLFDVMVTQAKGDLRLKLEGGKVHFYDAGDRQIETDALKMYRLVSGV